MSNNGVGGGLENAQKLLAKLAPAAAGGVIVLVLLVAGLTRVGCMNLHTPPGHEGYLRSKPIAGAGKFVGTQAGPTSTGWVWRQEIVNIDMRPQTYTEQMRIRTSRGSEISFRAHARIRLRHGSVKEVVDTFGGPNWYVANVQKQFQYEVRANVQQREPFEVKDRSLEIAQQVLESLQKRYAESPVEFLSVDIGDINYPESIVQSVIRKFVTYQENQKRDIELKIAQKQIEIGIAEAEGIADAQEIIRTTLDPMFLQYEALEAIEQLSESPNTTFVISPTSANGTAPMIMNLGK